jgi:hypothetical protein
MFGLPAIYRDAIKCSFNRWDHVVFFITSQIKKNLIDMVVFLL